MHTPICNATDPAALTECDYCGAPGSSLCSVDEPDDMQPNYLRHYLRHIARCEGATRYCGACGARYAPDCSWI